MMDLGFDIAPKIREGLGFADIADSPEVDVTGKSVITTTL